MKWVGARRTTVTFFFTYWIDVDLNYLATQQQLDTAINEESLKSFARTQIHFVEINETDSRLNHHYGAFCIITLAIRIQWTDISCCSLSRLLKEFVKTLRIGNLGTILPWATRNYCRRQRSLVFCVCILFLIACIKLYIKLSASSPSLV